MKIICNEFLNKLFIKQIHFINFSIILTLFSVFVSNQINSSFFYFPLQLVFSKSNQFITLHDGICNTHVDQNQFIADKSDFIKKMWLTTY